MSLVPWTDPADGQLTVADGADGVMDDDGGVDGDATDMERYRRAAIASLAGSGAAASDEALDRVVPNAVQSVPISLPKTNPATSAVANSQSDRSRRRVLATLSASTQLPAVLVQLVADYGFRHVLLSVGNDNALRLWAATEHHTNTATATAASASASASGSTSKPSLPSAPGGPKMAAVAAPAAAPPVSVPSVSLRCTAMRHFTRETSFARAIAVIDDNRLVMGAANGTVQVWAVDTHKFQPSANTKLSHAAQQLLDVPGSYAAQQLQSQQTRQPYQWADEKLDAAERLAAERSPLRCTGVMTGHTNGVVALAAVDTHVVASGSEDYSIRVWDVNAQKCVSIFDCCTTAVRCLAAVTMSNAAAATHTAAASASASAASGDNRLLIAGSMGSAVQVIDLRAAKPVASLFGHTKGVLSLAVLESAAGGAAGAIVCSGSADRTVRLWDLRTMRCTGLLDAHPQSVMAMAALPLSGQIGAAESPRLAVGCYDGTLRVWDARHSTVVSDNRAVHDGPVLAMSVFDGRIVTGGASAIHLWAMPSWQTWGVRTDVLTAAVAAGKVAALQCVGSLNDRGGSVDCLDSLYTAV